MTDAYQRALEQTREDISASINTAFDMLVSKADNARLPEDLFVSEFLPYFIGEAKLEELGRDVVTEWISVAGTPAAKVDIIDGNNNVLFTVPPLHDTNLLAVNMQSAGNKIADIYDEFSLRGAGVPAAAQRFLVNALGHKSQELTKNLAPNVTLSKQWEEIRARYRKTPATNVGSGTPDDNEELSYD